MIFVSVQAIPRESLIDTASIFTFALALLIANRRQPDTLEEWLTLTLSITGFYLTDMLFRYLWIRRQKQSFKQRN